MEALHAGQWGLAVGYFQRASQLRPDHVQTRIRLGELYLRFGQRETAEQLCAGLPAEALETPEARLLQARITAAEGRPLQARQLGAAILQEQPRSLDARLFLAQLGLQATATMDLRGARTLCQEALREFPKHYEARAMLLKAALRLGEFRTALEIGEDFARIYPEDRLTFLQMGTAALWLQDPTAIPLLQRAVELSLHYYRDRLKALWLLKLAYDQQGGYPPGLPDLYLFHAFSSPPPPGAPRFSDIASRAGVAKLDRGRGSAWLDFDLDGDLDLFSVGIRTVHALYRNEGGERFEDVTQAQGLADPRGGWGASCADFDNDGDPDLYVTRDGWEGAAPNSLYRNDQDRFVDVAPQAGAADSSSSFTATWGDFDLDGYLDLYVANGLVGDGGTNQLLHNQRDGRFRDVAPQAGVAHAGRSVGTAFGDYDNDRYPDLYVVDISQANRLYHNQGQGTFTDLAPQAGVTFPIEGAYVTFFFDYDNDGLLDLFVSIMSAFEDALDSMVTGKAVEPNRPFLYHNNGDGTFSDLTLHAGLARSFGSMGIGVGDVNNDGFPDIYLANGGPEIYRLEPNALFLNQRDGTFVDITQSAGVGNLGKGHGATFADFDQDGDLDLYAGLGGHFDGDVWPNSLYRNEGGGSHYLEVELEGTAGNRDGIGARVSLYAGTHQVHAELASGFGFGSSNPLSLHLGLGDHRRADRLVVRWPGGAQQTWEQIPADCAIRLIEGGDEYVVVRR
ncbi:MAG: VCBS repeat-containing protein [Candidatus Latescibacteria bacterium]|nr:VCBS repeat-containing protein [Candidatus Latescibacterota bacterium]